MERFKFDLPLGLLTLPIIVEYSYVPAVKWRGTEEDMALEGAWLETDAGRNDLLDALAPELVDQIEEAAWDEARRRAGLFVEVAA